MIWMLSVEESSNLLKH